MPTRKQKIDGVHYRNLEIRKGAILDEDKRLVRVSASSELPVLRSSFFRDPWIEVLGHDKDEVDLARLQNFASVHYNHSRDRADRIGVVESASIVNKRLQATVRISQREDVDDVWQDIRDGILKNISIGYTIGERKLTQENKDGPDEYRVTSWVPHEVSFVDIPSDPSVGVGRNESGELQYRVIDLGENTMPDKVTNIDAARKEGVAQERSRVSEINEIFSPYPDFEKFRTRAIDDGSTADDARKILLKEIGRDSSPAGHDAYRSGEFCDTHFSMPERRDDFIRAAVDAALGRANIHVKDPHPGAQDLMGRSLVDVARMCLGRNSINYGRMTNSQILERAFTTSDFPLILQDAANKSVLIGYDLAPATFAVVSRQTFAPDFKTQFKVAASAAPDLKLVNEDGEYTYSGVTEVGSTVSLATYGRLMAVSRQTIINDDLAEIMRALQSAGTAIARLQSDIVWGLITSNVVMSDGFPLFDSTNHQNVATAAALSVASLGEMKKLMRLQQAPKLNADDVIFLDLQPFVLVVPPSLETTAEQLLNSLADPSGVNQQTFNPFAHKLRLVVEPRLETDSTTRFYIMSDPNVFSWFDRIGLEGEPNGFLGQQEGWGIDGTEFKVRFDTAAVVNDHRGAVKNDGV